MKPRLMLIAVVATAIGSAVTTVSAASTSWEGAVMGTEDGDELDDKRHEEDDDEFGKIGNRIQRDTVFDKSIQGRLSCRFVNVVSIP